jgi:hypothetical protein
VRLTTLCSMRASEITDALVELLISLTHKINTRADRRVERELTEDLRRVRGKEAILFRLAEAAVARPDDTVRAALFPVVGRRLCASSSARPRPTSTLSRPRSVPCCAARTPITTGGCSRRCSRPLGFGGNNTAYRPVMQALELLARYAAVDGKTRVLHRRRHGPDRRGGTAGVARRGGRRPGSGSGSGSNRFQHRVPLGRLPGGDRP